MCNRFEQQRKQSPGFLVFAIAVLALLMMPVTYKAGASQPHPHALLQLLYEASRGIPLHHHVIDSTEPRTAHLTSEHAPMARSQQGHHPRAHAPVTPPSQPNPDIADSLSSSRSFQVIGAFAVMPALLAVLTVPARQCSRAPWCERALSGIPLPPEPPPPQHRS